MDVKQEHIYLYSVDISAQYSMRRSLNILSALYIHSFITSENGREKIMKKLQNKTDKGIFYRFLLLLFRF